MEENYNFVSCMKINGVPILPPLITPDRRKELLEYKEKAVLLEQAYQNKRPQPNLPEKKHLKDVMTSKNDQSACLEKVLNESDMKYVPYGNLSSDNSDQCKNLSSAEISDNIPNINESEPSGQLYKYTSYGCTDKIPENDVNQTEGASKPRLIRSNSYTLDTPSSILLDHLRRQSASSCGQTMSCVKNDGGFKSTKKSSQKPEETKEMPNDTNHPVDLKSNVSESTFISGAFNQPSLEVITTDITVQQINFTSPDINEDDIKNGTSYDPTNINMKCIGDSGEISSRVDPEIELHAILKQIPENYAKKIMSLIEEQKKEQLKRAQNYEFIKTQMLQSGDFEKRVSSEIPSPTKIFVKSAFNPPSNTAKGGSVNSISSRPESHDSQYYTTEKSAASSLNESQTLPFDISTSSSESLDNFSLRTFRILELKSEANDIPTYPNTTNPYFSKELILSEDEIRKCNELKDLKQSEIKRLKEEKAASIIGAYVKGYLVRRLMKTVKVKTIIQTIQDALVCALELQSSENIEEADVELHRKLIKLVSSACFEFHDIFFALSIPEQMDIIAMDREKLKKTLTVRSTRSSTEIRQLSRTSNIRASKSLTRI
ncbi:uncharacterized protein LOC123321532 [Coccinella septempunctata]|uniref:uncharacterized protein LOC123321532 n=1 Tax=Coccinella septempunctata TaxID=41139 RepID=UPI001D092C10|nr:uncharacterized protein LOC123321532 [Coccinella septempunctata]